MRFNRLTNRMSTTDPATSANARAVLGAIAVGGADAETFLQAQLSNDVEELGPADGRLAAWCDAKGRVQALPWVVRRDEDFLLLLPKTLVAPVLQRLRLFVLRSDVYLRDTEGELVVHGMLETPEGAKPGKPIRDGDLQYLALPGPGSRGIAVAPPPLAPEAADADAWRRAGILDGQPQVYPETQGRFVPQMLNLHWLGGIDFHKGCYPGQEVVARLQYRGRLTRRMFRGVLDAERTPPPGTPVTDGEDAAQGEVVDAAPGAGQQEVLAVLKIDAADGPLRIGGAELSLAPLPYSTD